MMKNTLLLFSLAAFLLATFEATSQKMLLPKEMNGKWGYTNLRGDMVVPYKFENAGRFIHSAACVKLKGKYGLINEQGQYLLEPSHDSLASKADAVVYAAAGLFGLLDTLGKRLTDPIYQRAEAGVDDTLNVKRDGQWYQRHGGIETPAELSSLVFMTAEEMPRFPGCKEVANKQELKECSEGEMLKFMYNNLKYPTIARENGVEGTVYVSFIVTRQGRIAGIKIVRDIGAGTGAEAVRVLQLMPDWIPGRMEGVPVACKFNLPVKYKLQ